MHYYFEKPRNRKAVSDTVIKRILVRCPTTAKLTPTGKSIDEQLWAETKSETHKMTCPHCRQVHSWSKKDVVLAR